MQSGAQFQVFGAIIDQVRLLVARAEKASQPTGVRGIVTAVIEDGTVLVAVNVHRIVPACIVGPEQGAVNGFVVCGLPVIRAEPEGVELEPKNRVAFIIDRVISIADGDLVEVPFAALQGQADARELIGGFCLHGHHAIEGARTVKCRRCTCHDVHTFHIEIRGTEEVAEGKVEAGALVVNAVDELK